MIENSEVRRKQAQDRETIKQNIWIELENVFFSNNICWGEIDRMGGCKGCQEACGYIFFLLDGIKR